MILYIILIHNCRFQPPTSIEEMCYKMYCFDPSRKMCITGSEQRAAMGTSCGDKKVRVKSFIGMLATSLYKLTRLLCLQWNLKLNFLSLLPSKNSFYDIQCTSLLENPHLIHKQLWLNLDVKSVVVSLTSIYIFIVLIQYLQQILSFFISFVLYI